MTNRSATTTRLFRGSPAYYERAEGIVFGKNALDFLSLNLPPVCNYRCRFCFAGETAGNQCRMEQIRTRSLSGDEYTDLIREAARLGVKHLEISGEGEPDLPMFRETLRHMIEQATRNNIRTCLFVNGSLLDEPLLRFLRDQNVSLVISIKHMDPARYDQAVGIGGAYGRVMENIGLARSFFGGHEDVNGFSVYRLALFGMVLEDNEQDNARLRMFCDENGIFFGLSTRIPHGLSEGMAVDQVKQEVVVDRYAHGSMILADSSQERLHFPVCGTFYFGLGIGYDGEVVFDAHADDTKGMIGNVRTIGLAEAVRRQREMRDAFYREGGCSYCPLRDRSYLGFISRYRQRG